MKKAGAGHIINIGSGAATNGIAQMSCYCGTKHAVAGISESLHLELRDYGIKVSCVSPGSVDTGFSSSKKNKLKPEDLAQTIIHLLQADRKSTRLNSSHVATSYAGFRLKTKRAV